MPITDRNVDDFSEEAQELLDSMMIIITELIEDAQKKLDVIEGEPITIQVNVWVERDEEVCND